MSNPQKRSCSIGRSSFVSEENQGTKILNSECTPNASEIRVLVHATALLFFFFQLPGV